jgi:hypothetical protein
MDVVGRHSTTVRIEDNVALDPIVCLESLQAMHFDVVAVGQLFGLVEDDDILVGFNDV